MSYNVIICPWCETDLKDSRKNSTTSSYYVQCICRGNPNMAGFSCYFNDKYEIQKFSLRLWISESQYIKIYVDLDNPRGLVQVISIHGPKEVLIKYDTDMVLNPVQAKNKILKFKKLIAFV